MKSYALDIEMLSDKNVRLDTVQSFHSASTGMRRSGHKDARVLARVRYNYFNNFRQRNRKLINSTI